MSDRVHKCITLVCDNFSLTTVALISVLEELVVVGPVRTDAGDWNPSEPITVAIFASLRDNRMRKYSAGITKQSSSEAYVLDIGDEGDGSGLKERGGRGIFALGRGGSPQPP